MGNKPNNFIQCGFSDKDNKQETILTRQEAVRKTREQPIPNSTFVQSKINTNKNIFNSNSTIQSKTPKSTNFRLNSSQKQSNFTIIPQHQNIVRVSKVPKNKYIIYDSELYQEERGKCLDQIIQSRYHTTMHFPQKQILGLLQSLVYSLAYLTKKDVNYHDFYPTNIFYNNGAFKILNPLTIKFSGYALTQQRKRFSFLSPELIFQILHDKSELDIKKDVMDKSDVFAIGMILLQFCTLMPSSQCYDPQTYSIVDQKIQQRIDKACSLYNPLISQCIDLMLQYEVDNRISPLQLAYAVHSKMLEITIEQTNQASRIKQMSRMAMSAKIPQLRPLQGLPQPPSIQGFPPVHLQNTQPFIVGSSPMIYPPNATNPLNNPAVFSNNYSYPYNVLQNPPSLQIPKSQPLIKAEENSTYAPKQSYVYKYNILPSPNSPVNNFNQISKLQVTERKTSPDKKYYVTSQAKTSDQNKNINVNNIQQETQNKLKSDQQLRKTVNQVGKYKFNPFEEIKQDLEEKESSPQGYKKYIYETRKQGIDNKYDNFLQQRKQISNKAQFQGETLDQKVKRILQASKNIK